MKKRNKKGYIRTIEAILAVLIVFAFVVTILPKKPIETGKAPPGLDSTLRNILEEAQNNEEFRTCLLLKNDVILMKDSIESGDNTMCLKTQLEKSLPAFSPWDFGFAICPGSSTTDCALYAPQQDAQQTPRTGSIDQIRFPFGKSIYTKSTVLAVPDIIARPFKVKGSSCCKKCPFPLLTCSICELNSNLDTCLDKISGKFEGKTIYLYLWEK